jgi:hypothetical protein
MFNNSTNIYKTNNQIPPQIIEHKRDFHFDRCHTWGKNIYFGNSWYHPTFFDFVWVPLYGKKNSDVMFFSLIYLHINYVSVVITHDDANREIQWKRSLWLVRTKRSNSMLLLWHDFVLIFNFMGVALYIQIVNFILVSSKL